MTIGSFRGQVHVLEKEKGTKPITIIRLKQEKLKTFFKKFESKFSQDESDWIKRVLYDEEIFVEEYINDDFFDVVMNRRSLRTYGMPLKIHDINIIVKCGMIAPSSCNRQPLEILIINAKSKIKKIAEIKKQDFISESNTLIIPLADKRVYPTPNKNNISSFYYFLFSDMGAAIQNMLLASEKLNIAMCWVNLATTVERNKIKNLLEIPLHFIPIALLPCGYKIENGTRPGRKNIKLHYNYMED